MDDTTSQLVMSGSVADVETNSKQYWPQEDATIQAVMVDSHGTPYSNRTAQMASGLT